MNFNCPKHWKHPMFSMFVCDECLCVTPMLPVIGLCLYIVKAYSINQM